MCGIGGYKKYNMLIITIYFERAGWKRQNSIKFLCFLLTEEPFITLVNFKPIGNNHGARILNLTATCPYD